ncbi:uncharacterized protein LOC134711111 [Mytilus trossulus]|uniref:uncharacterized protein LOC134711111 n=1 Tax=Mytilus trossulus TaxID=6551 RepID=UPI00300771CE
MCEGTNPVPNLEQRGTLLLVNSTDNYVRGGYIYPLYDKSKWNNKRKTIGLIISLDENGSAKGEIQIKKILRNQKEDDYVKLRLFVSKGNCLIVRSMSTNKDNNNLEIDFIQFYGLYGFPDGFSIDKRKKYKVEDDLSKNRRIFNQNRIYTFSHLQLDTKTDHIIRWTYF